MTHPSVESSADSAFFEDEIDKIQSLIAGAGRLVGERKPVDLGLLEDRVGALCAAITKVPPSVAKPLTGRLEEILTMLNVLEGALTETFGPAHTLAESDARLQASKSYPGGAGKDEKKP